MTSWLTHRPRCHRRAQALKGQAAAWQIDHSELPQRFSPKLKMSGMWTKVRLALLPAPCAVPSSESGVPPIVGFPTFRGSFLNTRILQTQLFAFPQCHGPKKKTSSPGPTENIPRGVADAGAWRMSRWGSALTQMRRDSFGCIGLAQLSGGDYFLGVLAGADAQLRPQPARLNP